MPHSSDMRDLQRRELLLQPALPSCMWLRADNVQRHLRQHCVVRRSGSRMSHKVSSRCIRLSRASNLRWLRWNDGSGLNWCAEADSPCPLYNCSKGQVACLEDEVYTCHDRRDGCPANCSKHQHVCHSAPEADCPDCVAVNWCSDEKCPEACSHDEITCLHKHGTTCRLLSQGCPVHCNASQHSCHSPPPCKGCTGSNWCSDVPCPFVCASDEIQCTGSNGTEFCAAVADGCPVTCRDEDYICHMPPQCPECVGTNWCSAEPCATSV